MCVSWLKWKFYIRWKNQWGKFINKNNKLGYSLAFIGVFLDLIQAIFYFSMSCAVLKLIIMNENISSISINSQYVMYFVQNISQVQQNESLIWWIYFFVLIMFSFVVGIKASKWNLSSKDREWLKLNLKIKHYNVDNLIFFETIFWNLRLLVLRVITFLLSICVITNQGVFQTINLVIFSLSFYVFLSLMICYLHYSIIIYKMCRVSKVYMIFQLILWRVIYVYLGYSLTNILSPWIAKYPFLGKNLNPEELNQWFFEGYKLFLSSISGVLSQKWMPYVLITHLIEKKLSFIGTFICLGFIIILYNFYRLFSNYINTKDRITTTISLEKYLNVLFNSNFLNHKYILLKTFYKSPYLLSKLSYVFGDIIYWITIGLFSGLLLNLGIQDKIHQLLLLFLLLFHIYFFAERYYKNLSGLLSLESDGFNVLIYLNANKNLWYVFKQKFFLYLTSIIPLIIIGDIVIWSVGKVSLADFFSICIVHSIGVISFGLLNYLPSVMFPHFEFLNVEEINEFGDKKMVESIVNNVILIVIIPVLSLPTIMYILDYSLKNTLNNTIILCACLLLISIIIMYFIKRRLNKHNYIL